MLSAFTVNADSTIHTDVSRALVALCHDYGDEIPYLNVGTDHPMQGFIDDNFSYCRDCDPLTISSRRSEYKGYLTFYRILLFHMLYYL